MFTLALKNILFYKGRSLTTFILTFVSTVLLILYVALMDGAHLAMLHNALKIYTGTIEIYHKGYREVGGNDYLITSVKHLESRLDTIKGISAYTSRYETYGLLSSGNNSAAAMVTGIHPENEIGISELAHARITGEFLTKDSQNCLYAGEGLAKKLQVRIGGEISFIGSASDGSFAADLFKLCGIFRTGLFEFDATSSFVTKSYFDELMYTKDKASYITLRLDDLNSVNTVNNTLNTILSKDFESVSWKTLMKPMVEAMKVDSIFGYISLSLFLVVIFFVIMIFGFINVSSRIREFGILRCLGLSHMNIRSLLFFEILMLCNAAILLATPIGAAVAYHYSIHPIIIEGISETYKQYGIVSNAITFHFDPWTIGWNVGIIYLLNFLSILYPLAYLNAFEPVEAVHHV